MHDYTSDIGYQSVASTASVVETRLAADGIAVLRRLPNRHEMFAIASRLGYVWNDRRIYVNAELEAHTRSPAGVHFHMDHARANVIGWLCEVPDACFNRYVDALRLYRDLPESERDALTRVRCFDPYPVQCAQDPQRPTVIAPAVERVHGATRIFWVPAAEPESDRLPDSLNPFLLIPQGPDAAVERRAIETFRAAVERFDAAPELAHVSVMLAPGDAVFVDNNRFLHGRGALPAASPRELYRVWVNSDGWSSARRWHLDAPSEMASRPRLGW
jgi:alpha-ketoglutarate-dependent taurine dioxygenase